MERPFPSTLLQHVSLSRGFQEWVALKKYDIRFDIIAKEPPYFWVANAATRKIKGDRHVPLGRLLTLDQEKPIHQQELQRLAKEIKRNRANNCVNLTQDRRRRMRAAPQPVSC